MKSCRCIAMADKALAERNTRIVVTFPLMGGCEKAVLRTESLQKLRGGSNSKPVAVIATYCPFCGKKYPMKESKP